MSVFSRIFRFEELPELDAEIVVEEIPETENACDEQAPEGLSVMEQALVQDTLRIAQLEEQLHKSLAMIAEQNEMLSKAADIIIAARKFAELVTKNNEKTGEPLFKVNGERDDPLSRTISFLYSDLAAALNGIGRPVPPKLAEGTVH